MGLGRSTFYDAPAISIDETELVARMQAICNEFEAYGYRRVDAALRQQGVIADHADALSRRALIDLAGTAGNVTAIRAAEVA